MSLHGAHSLLELTQGKLKLQRFIERLIFVALLLGTCIDFLSFVRSGGINVVLRELRRDYLVLTGLLYPRSLIVGHLRLRRLLVLDPVWLNLIRADTVERHNCGRFVGKDIQILLRSYI